MIFKICLDKTKKYPEEFCLKGIQSHLENLVTHSDKIKSRPDKLVTGPENITHYQVNKLEK